MSPFLKEESNADISQWNYILEKYSNNYPKFKVLLLGDDSKHLNKLSNVISLSENNFNLYEQLSISQNVGFFLGLASGFCTAANLYTSPYVILKSPQHDTKEIKKELINQRSLPMSVNKQFFRIVNPTNKDIYSILEDFKSHENT